MAQCKALATPNTSWDFCPSLGASYLFIVLFGLTTLAHIAQAILFRKFYCWVIAMSGAFQTVSYIFRVLSILHPANDTDYILWFVLILIAPLWTNAFVYMVMGRMVWNFTDDVQVLRLRPWRFGSLFVILDIIAFIIQVYGAGQASGNDVSFSDEMLGLHVYMAGVGAQQLFVLMFVVCAISFHRKILRQRRPDLPKALLLLYVLYACLALVTMRIIFRLCEYAQGLNSTIPHHEAYQYCLDSLPMLVALVMLNVVHPGRIMPGKDSDMPSRKGRKNISLHGPARLEDGMMLREQEGV
ncbi:RTA1 like protein-domain-containing protein [Aspergillus varians]